MAVLNILTKQNKPVIDTTGPNGNVFYLIAQVKPLSKILEIDPQPILEDMMSDDYDHAIEVFDKNFGEICDLYIP